MKNILNLNQKQLESQGFLTVSIFFSESEAVHLTNEVLDFNLEFQLNKLSRGYFIWNDIDGKLFNDFVISGNERLRIAFSTLNTKEKDEEFWSKDYVIYGYTPIDRKTNPMLGTKNKYKILFCSPIQMLNHMNKMNRGFPGEKKASDIIESIFKTEYQLEEKEYEITPTENSIENFIAPNVYPKEVIDAFKKSAKSDDGKDFFTFFEDRDQLRFVSLAQMMSQDPKLAVARPLGGLEKDIIPTKVLRDETVSGINVLKSQVRAGLGFQFTYFDYVKKEVVEDVKTLDEDLLNDIKTLGKYSVYNEEMISDFQYSNKLLYNFSKLADIDIYNNYLISSNLLQNNIFKITLPINLMVDIGDIIYVPWKSNYEKENLAFTGYWLIIKTNFRYTNQMPDGGVGKNRFLVDYYIVKNAYENMSSKVKGKDKLCKIKDNLNILLNE